MRKEQKVLAAIAERFNAYTLTDEFGYVALVQRMHDEEGIEQVQYYPDPCDFFPLERILENPKKHLR